MNNRFFVGCGLIVVALIAVAGFLYWRARTPPVVTQVAPFQQAAPQEQERRRAEAQKLVEEVEDVARAAKNRENKSFRIEASEEQINTLLQDRLDTKRFLIRDLSIGLQPDNLAIQGTANYQGLEDTLTLEGNVTVENGELKYSANSIKIGGFPGPESLRTKIEDEVTKQLNKLLADAPGQIQDVRVEAGRLIVSGVTR